MSGRLILICAAIGLALGLILPGHSDRGCAAANDATFWRAEAMRAYAGEKP